MQAEKKATVTLPTERQILITREFEAPAHLVFEAWTTPELVERWWHANRGDVTSVEIDLRPGGSWRWAMTAASNGMEVAFRGEYLEVVPDERLVWTETFEAMHSSAAVNTLTLEEVDGRTQMTLLVEHDSREARDIHINSGMEDGLQDALELLEQLARSRS